MSTETLTVTSPTPLSHQHDTSPVLQQINIQEPDPAVVSLLHKWTVTIQLSAINFASSAVNGLVVVGLPAITADLAIPQELSLWPTSVASLANASTLLLAGSIADSIGPRKVNLTGGFVSGAFMLGAGFSQNGSQLVAMRALQGIGYAMHLASSVAIITSILPRGRSRNIGFACLGLSQPLGFSFGLVIGGVLQNAIGWRAGWYIYGALTILCTIVAIFATPKQVASPSVKESLRNAKEKVDWIGALLATAFMALLSYLFANISADVNSVRDGPNIALICICGATLPGFLFWMHRQVRIGKPALIPLSMWKNRAFSVICITVAISFGVTTCIELFSSLFFQEVQGDTALIAGLKVLPSLIVGTVINFTTGLYVDKFSARTIVAASFLACAVAPLLMAVVQPTWSYWANAFIAQVLSPISNDILFTVGLIVISDVFPDDTQALAGAVFNTCAQFGIALCLAIMQIISATITKDHGNSPKPLAVLEGLRASFWAMFAMFVGCAILGIFGLRTAGRVGLKRD